MSAIVGFWVYGRCGMADAWHIDIYAYLVRLLFQGNNGRTNPTTWLVIRESFDWLRSSFILLSARSERWNDTPRCFCTTGLTVSSIIKDINDTSRVFAQPILPENNSKLATIRPPIFGRLAAGMFYTCLAWHGYVLDEEAVIVLDQVKLFRRLFGKEGIC